MSLREAVRRQYGKRVAAFEKYRDVYRLRLAGHGNRCLKPSGSNERDAIYLSRVYRHLAQKGFNRGPRTDLTTRGKMYFEWDGTYYMLTKWINGRPPRLKKKKEWRQAVALLARFHRTAEGLDTADAPPSRLRYDGLQHQVEQYRQRLEKELNISRLLAMCDLAAERLNDPLAKEAVQKEKDAGAFTHGDYNYPNLVLDSQRRLHMIDFENSSHSPRMSDLAHLLHRNCGWDAERTLEAVRLYHKHRQLSIQDRHLLFALLLIPYPVIRKLRLGKRAGTGRIPVPSSQTINKYVRGLRKLL
ncbi:hypothetical protein J31TS4_24020 [Paenibacillus sp. J31TS4]|uniref:phosphotransferase n=1 Tax=Paenibacillus sp. J31TS4 TaxID=2807195 RepID=UPI001B2F0CD1|nr:phosphotransferase [Paenibacillus sp. J31TS4]GIP39122.1 hypothetical protein J31TS4_24020 [Paenibacillus sp. J31TS4]